MKMTVTPRHDGDVGYFCNKARHDEAVTIRPHLGEVCNFCLEPCVRHLLTEESYSKTLQSDSPRTPLCQQHYEEWAAYLGLHELVIGHE